MKSILLSQLWFNTLFLVTNGENKLNINKLSIILLVTYHSWKNTKSLLHNDSFTTKFIIR